MIAILVFNMVQRSHQEHGEKKRFATLNMAIILLLLNGSLAVILRYGLPDTYILAGVGIAAVAAFIMRKKTFIFKLRCSECGTLYPAKQILLYDNPECSHCASGPAAEITNSDDVPDRVSAIDWDGWVPSETAVLCFVEDGDKLMLIHKKTGLGAGKINAPGGRIEPGETPEQAAVRETIEETGITPSELEEKGRLHFQFKDGYSLKGHVFFARKFSGQLTETDEADPFWCTKSDIPYGKMWEDDILWLPLTLEGKNIEGRFVFDGDTMLDQDVQECEAWS